VPTLLTRQRLIYPAGFAPGFDPSHPAAVGIGKSRGLSAIAATGNFINLLTGIPAVPLHGDSTVTIREIGPTANIPASGDNGSWAGNSTVNATSATMAAIWFPLDTTGFNTLVSNSTTGVGTQLIASQAGNGTVALNNWGNTNWGATPSYVANAPHFVAISGNPSASAGVTINLQTGLVNVSTGSSGTPTVGNGTYTSGSVANGGSTTQLYLAATMWSPSYTSLEDLLKWAADPWSFWYPRSPLTQTSKVGISVSGAAQTPYQPYFQQMLASKREPIVGWREGYDHRWRRWRRERGLIVPK